MAILEVIYFEFNIFIHIYIYSGSSTIIRFKYIKTQCIFIKITSFDEVVIMLHKFDSNSEHTFFILWTIFGFLLKIVSCDKRLILKEHLTNSLKSKMKAHVGQNSVMHINCRSVNLKVDELILLLTQIPVTFLALSETWIDEDDTNTLTIPGYNTVSKPGKGRQGGGVALLIREDIIFNQLEVDTLQLHNSYEGVFLVVPQLKGPDTVLGSVYRPPGGSITEFNEELTVLLTSLSKKRSRIIIGGDFNIDLLKTGDHDPSQDFINIMNSESFLPTINYPTRITNHSATIIDNIFVNCYHDIIDPTIVISGFFWPFPFDFMA